jgi:hypothetical protein
VLAQVSELIPDIGVVAGTVIAVGGAVAVLSRARPIRFILRKIVGEPIVGWIQRDAVTPALDAHRDAMATITREIINEHTSREETIAQDLAKEMRNTFAKRSAEFEVNTRPWRERFTALEAGQEGIVQRLDDLARQGASDSAKTMHRLGEQDELAHELAERDGG